MDQDYREVQRIKWEKTKEASVVASSSSTALPSQQQLPATGISRLHILPLTREGKTGPNCELALLAPRLRQLRDDGITIETGSVLEVDGWDYVAVGVEPSSGSTIGPTTEFFFDGDAVRHFEKVQFLAMSDLSSSVLFKNHVRPYFTASNETPGLPRVNIAQKNQNFEIDGITFCIAETSPPGFGVLDKDTIVYVESDSTPEFDKIHVVPFHDTLPQAYEYDIFNDYVRPFFRQSQLLRFKVQNHFTYQGVQFKVVCCEPDDGAARRVGKSTTIYCEGVLHPSLRTLLPQELLRQLSFLPPGLQILLLNADAFGTSDVYERLMNVQEMLTARRGMATERIEQIESYKWEEAVDDAQVQCMVCLCDFEPEQTIRKLPCSHEFHVGCIDEWLGRCTDCPICKTNADTQA